MQSMETILKPFTTVRAAALAESVLTLIAISFAALGFWRIGTDLGLAGDFVFRTGFLSHWQVWFGMAIAVRHTKIPGRRAQTGSSRDRRIEAAG